MSRLHVFLIALLLFNLWLSYRLLRSDLPGMLKTGYLLALWFLPPVGTFMAFFSLRNTAAATNTSVQAEPLPKEAIDDAAPTRLVLSDGQVFDIEANLVWANGLPLLHWDAYHAWSATLPTDALRQTANDLAKRAWLLHLRDAIGPHCQLYALPQTYILSGQEPSVALAAARYVETTRKRIDKVLQNLAAFPTDESSVLLVMDDEDSYYHYVSIYYPEEGEFAFSGGMFLSGPCPHFVVKAHDLRQIEPVIAHELTHSALAHLGLPTWIDEGIAVNTEQRLTGVPAQSHTPHQLRDMHRQFWNEARIQTFWSGDSFFQPGDSNLLSYDLARMLVDYLARDWDSFSRFVAQARRMDGGESALNAVFAASLGDYVCALLEKPESAAWQPDAARWQAA